MRKVESTLRISTSTWLTESYNLYDYEATQLSCQNLDISKTGQLMRTHSQIYFNEKELFDPLVQYNCINYSILAVIEIIDNRIVIYPSYYGQQSKERNIFENLYLIIKYSPMKLKDKHGHHIKKGDLIKLGRVVVKLVKIDIHKDTRPTKPIDSSISFNSAEEIIIIDDKIKEEENQKRLCRICYGTEESETNPLITPCSCSGSMKFIHLICLKEWIKLKVTQRETQHCLNISMTEFACELCKQQFPFFIYNGGKKFSLLEYKCLSSPSATFEIYDKEEKQLMGLVIISFAYKSEISVGRSHECDFRIDDISVSRSHCLMIFNENRIFIEDRSSKFGTLVRVSYPFILHEQTNVHFQAGRTKFETKYKKKIFINQSSMKWGRVDSKNTLMSNQRRSAGDFNEEEDEKSSKANFENLSLECISRKNVHSECNSKERSNSISMSNSPSKSQFAKKPVVIQERLEQMFKSKFEGSQNFGRKKIIFESFKPPSLNGDISGNYNNLVSKEEEDEEEVKEVKEEKGKI